MVTIWRSQFPRKIACTAYHSCLVRDGCHDLMCLKRELWQKHLELVGEYAHGAPSTGEASVTRGHDERITREGQLIPRKTS